MKLKLTMVVEFFSLFFFSFSFSFSFFFAFVVVATSLFTFSGNLQWSDTWKDQMDQMQGRDENCKCG